MRTVLESVQSYLGLFCEDRKPKSKGYGCSGHGFPLLTRRSKAKAKEKASGYGDKGKQLSRKGSSSRVHSLHTITHLDHSDPNFSPVQGNLSQFQANCSPSRRIVDRIKSLGKGNNTMSFRNCLVKMYSRRDSVRNHVDDPFDKCTTEYYSCGKKGAHTRRLASEFVRVIDRADDEDDVHASSSVESDTEVSDGRHMKAYTAMHDVGPVVKLSSASKVQQVGQSLLQSAQENDCDYDDHGKMGEFSLIPAEKDDHGNDDSCDHMGKISHILVASDDHSSDASDKMGEFSSVLVENEVNAHNAIVDCETGCQSSNEEESNLEGGLFSLVSSPARGHRRRFPPPLSSLAMHSYHDKSGQAAGACGAGYCLRSLRRDGRFVLQEVKAPTHMYFRVSRKDGRLKLEMINPVNDSSLEEDETNDSDVCPGLRAETHCLSGSNHVVVNMGLDMEAWHTFKVQDEDACVGSYRENQNSSEVEVRGGLNTGSLNTSELVGTFGENMRVEKASKHADSSTAELASMVEVKTETSYTSFDVVHTSSASECAGEFMASTSLIFSKEAIGQEIESLGPFIESPSSPGCSEISALCNGQSSSMKSSWVHPIPTH